jgi:predicted glycosyltransferase
MNNKNALIYCCRSEKHIGSLHRAIALAAELSESLDVTILLDENTPMLVDVPESTRLVYLPPLRVDPDSNVFDFTGSEHLKDSIIRRRDVILDVFEELKPRLVVIDNFPFHQHRLRGEVLPMIERAHNGVYGESLVVCTTDSIMVDDTASGENRADVAASLLDKYFDLVIVQSDPVFARLEEFFKPRNTPLTPVYHTGFVMPAERASSSVAGDRDDIVVSAGDGRYGAALFRTAIEAQRVLWPVSQLSMKIITGPRLPEEEYCDLVTRAEAAEGVEVVRIVDSIRAEMAKARCSVSQCGYHTALNAIFTQTASLFVPCQQGQRGEQTVRAQRLVYWGGGRLLMPHHLNAASLTNDIYQLLQLQPRKISFDMDGAANAAKLIERAMHLSEIGGVSVNRSTDGWTRQ